MVHESETSQSEHGRADEVLMPEPTVWPLVLAVGITLMFMGLMTNWILSAAGLAIAIAGIWYWVADVLPGRGHMHEPMAPPEKRPRPPAASLGTVEHLRPDMIGYRIRMPEQYHPYSAGVIGGAYGMVAMAIIALAYGLVSRDGLWYPINLLAGMILPSFGEMTREQLQQFSFLGIVLGVFIHVTASLGLGLMYGVILPMLPYRPVIWGGIVGPLLWTPALYTFMGLLNEPLRQHVDWYSFVIAQFAYGLTVGYVVMKRERVYMKPRGRGAAGTDQPSESPPQQEGGS
jgi:hypothetical protein